MPVDSPPRRRAVAPSDFWDADSWLDGRIDDAARVLRQWWGRTRHQAMGAQSGAPVAIAPASMLDDLDVQMIRHCAGDAPYRVGGPPMPPMPPMPPPRPLQKVLK